MDLCKRTCESEACLMSGRQAKLHRDGWGLTRIACRSLSFWRSNFSKSATFIIVSFSTSRSFSVTWERRQREHQRDERRTDQHSGHLLQLHSLHCFLYTASSVGNKIYPAAWRSKTMTQHLALIFITLHVLLRNSQRIFTPILPHHSQTLRAEFVMKFKEWCQGCLRPFHMKKAFAKQRGIQRQQARKNNNKIVSNTVFSSILHPIIIPNHLWKANTE